MKKVHVKLADLFRSKATEENQDGQTTDTKEGEGGESGEGESTEEGDGGEGESGEEEGGEGEATGEGESTEGQATGEASDVREIEMTASAFNTMKTNAAEYVKVKGELETLRGWKASMDKVNGGLGKADQSDRNGKKGPSVLDSPWNQAAVAAAERLK